MTLLFRYQKSNRKQMCHPDRSVAERRDLQFRGPLLEMFSDQGVEVRALAHYTFPPKKHRTFTTQLAHSFIVK